MNIVLVGAPLSGKGTQAELISKNFDLVHISIGDVFREIKGQNTPLGSLVNSYVSKAKLVPDDVTIKVLKEKLSTIPHKNGVLLDGFPRTLYQAQQLDNFLKIDAVVYLDVSLDSVLKRIENRYVCSVCKKTNTAQNKLIPCIYCGGTLEKRADDSPETVRSRFKEFELFTQPVIDYYNSKQKLILIHGHKSMHEVFEDIRVKLEAL